jgi:hypothetical protein
MEQVLNKIEEKSLKVNFSIPIRPIRATIIFLGITAFTVFQFIAYVIPGYESIYALINKKLTIQDTSLMWVPPLAYVFTATVIYSFMGILKKNKPYHENALAQRMVCNLFTTFIFINAVSAIYVIFSYQGNISFLTWQLQLSYPIISLLIAIWNPFENKK